MDTTTLLRCIRDLEKANSQCVDEGARELNAAVLLFNNQVRLLGASQSWLIPTKIGTGEGHESLDILGESFLAMSEDEVAMMHPEQVFRHIPRLSECLRTEEGFAAAEILHHVVKWHGAELLGVQELRLAWRRISASLENLMECDAGAEQRDRVGRTLQMIGTLMR
ncbi:hypothetical protein JKF63_00998 [Porcisia hertigi]|uniref:Uncharacterized protein n=1 Tax=Porcisia hertigi TaxID=2761500 RepID=A0A836HCP7_9TRYP|nr:hypothetical protein JKF63_00998 [Porcisia hertigi]